MGDSGVAGEQPIGLEQVGDSLGEGLPKGGKLVPPGWVAKGEINRAGCDLVPDLPEIAVVDLILLAELWTVPANLIQGVRPLSGVPDPAELLYIERSIRHLIAKFPEQALGFDSLGVAGREHDRLAVGLAVEPATSIQVRNLLTCL
jgi:hypothetical protein